eukprot:scaffold957_cov322-Pavlova_lutheri.AAC.4
MMNCLEILDLREYVEKEPHMLVDVGVNLNTESSKLAKMVRKAPSRILRRASSRYRGVLKHCTTTVAPSPLEAPVLPRLSLDDDGYSPNREASERFSIIFGQFPKDLFAPAHDAQCPPFFTRETNALAQEWASLGNLWAHQLCCLIDSVVSKLEAEPRALVTMITPHWPKAPWFPRLQHLATHQEVLGRHEGLFTDSRGRPMPAPHWDVLLSHVPRRMQGSD